MMNELANTDELWSSAVVVNVVMSRLSNQDLLILESKVFINLEDLEDGYEEQTFL